MSKAHLFAPMKWVKEQFAKLNGDLEWKLIGEVSGASTLTLPSEWNELHIIVYASQYSVFPLDVIPSDKFATSVNLNFGTYFNASSYVNGSVLLTDSTVSIGSFIADGTDHKTKGSAKLKVYYR